MTADFIERRARMLQHVKLVLWVSPQKCAAPPASPRNGLPSLIKQFVRSLGRLRTTVARFGADEWNPPLLVLLELLRARAPEVAEHLLNGEAAAACRAGQRDFLYSCADRLKDRASDVLRELKPWDASPLEANMVGVAEITEARERLNAMFACVVAEEVLTRFRRRGAIAAVAEFMSHPAEIWLLLDRESPFHDSSFRARLTELCGETDLVISENCLTYLRMLVGGEGFSSSALAQDADLVVPLWRAVIRISPQPRMPELIRDLATRLRAGLPDPALIQLPAWAGEVVDVDGPEPADLDVLRAPAGPD